MATVREFSETNPTQERSTSGGGLRRKRLNRPTRPGEILRSNVRAAFWPEQSQTQRAGKCGGVSSTADRFANLPKRTHRTRTTSRQNEANGIAFDVLAERSRPGERHRWRLFVNLAKRTQRRSARPVAAVYGASA